MFIKILTTISLSRFAFLILPKGSDALDCSVAEIRNCEKGSYPKYFPQLGLKPYICSGTAKHMECINRVTDYCKTKPRLPLDVMSIGLYSTNKLEQQRIKYRCATNNGGGGHSTTTEKTISRGSKITSGGEGQKTSLILIAVACLSALKFYN